MARPRPAAPGAVCLGALCVIGGGVGSAGELSWAAACGRTTSIHAPARQMMATKRPSKGRETWSTVSVIDHLAALLSPTGRSGPLGEANAELAQLPIVDRCRRAGQRVGAAGRLRKRHHVADRVASREQRDDPVQAERDAAVRRSAEAQRLEQEAEPLLRLLFGKADRLEDLLLDLDGVGTDRSPAELPAVDDQVI